MIHTDPHEVEWQVNEASDGWWAWMVGFMHINVGPRVSKDDIMDELELQP